MNRSSVKNFLHKLVPNWLNAVMLVIGLTLFLGMVTSFTRKYIDEHRYIHSHHRVVNGGRVR